MNATNPAGSVFVSANRLETSAGVCLHVDSGSIEVAAQSFYASADFCIHIEGGSGAVVVRAQEILSETSKAVHYDAYPSGPTLAIYSARIKSNATSGGHAI
jgi:hypothetical protein